MRRTASLIAIAAAVLAIPSAAAASWQATGSGSGYSHADSLAAGNTPTTSVSGRNVTVNWTATTGNVPVTGYVLKRYDASSGVQQTIGSGCSGTVAGTSCTEAAVPPGSWKYSVTPARQNWRGGESAKSSAATVGSPTLALSPNNPTITCRPGTLSGTITNFITGHSATFHLDSPTGTTLSGSTTPTTIPTNGQATVSVTIPTTVTGGSHTVYVVDSGDTATSPSASFTVDALRVATGTYTGNGTSQTITGLGFQPDAVIDKTSANTAGAVMSTTAMGANATKPLSGATAPTTGMITSLTAPTNGFSVGNNAATNSNGKTYYWTAFKWIGDSGVGSYTGNGAAGHAITGLGFSPEYLIGLGNVAQPAAERISPSSTTYSFDKTGNATLGGKGAANGFTSFDSGGFTVGTNAAVNNSGTTYYYAAFNQCANQMQTGSYAGNNATQQVSGVGFSPSFLNVRGDDTGTARDGVMRNAAISGSESQLFSATADNTTNMITSLSVPTSGFTVGNNAATGANGVTYDYAAFTDQP